MSLYSDLMRQRFKVPAAQADIDDLRKFVILITSVAFFHVALIIFFSVEFKFKKSKERPDLEIELASNIQTVGNSDTTALDQKGSQQREKSQKKQSKSVVTQQSVAEEINKVKQDNSLSQSSDSAGVVSATQLAGGVPNANDTHGPKLLNNVKPKYPLEAYKKRVEGTVILYAQVTETGSVGVVKVGVSSGEEALDISAIEAVKEWKFSPGKASGKIAAQWIKVPITFNLKK
jgi:protein TonB